MSDAHAGGGPPMFSAEGARSPSHAERVRTLVAGARDGTLSTLLREPEGYPFGSVVTYGLDGAGRPLVLMSTMAEHARNLAADPRVSLLVSEAGDGAGRLAAARATLVGTLSRVPPAEADAAAEGYLAAHPDAFWARFSDFFPTRLHVVAVRYVRGFGEMSWVEPADYTAATADPVAEAEAGVVQHMNDDHADALLEIVRSSLPVSGVVSAQMLSCDRYGFDVQLQRKSAGVAFGRLGFDEVLTSADQTRRAMVTLTRRARATASG